MNDDVISSIYAEDGDIPNPTREGYLRFTKNAFVMDDAWVKKNLRKNFSTTENQREAMQEWQGNRFDKAKQHNKDKEAEQYDWTERRPSRIEDF